MDVLLLLVISRSTTCIFIEEKIDPHHTAKTEVKRGSTMKSLVPSFDEIGVETKECEGSSEI